MAETKKQDEGQKTNPGTPDAESTDTADTAAAKAAGLTEGDIKALRDDAGLNQTAGHTGDILQWEQSPAGEEFKKGEKDRQKAAKEEEKRYSEQFNKDGLTEAEAKYVEVVNKG
jgi:hypothetical protein